MTVCACCAADLHPFECGGNCEHCRRAITPDHDPAVCELCDPAYDMQPNVFYEARLEREARQ